MIKISFNVDQDGTCYGFDVQGHAGYAPRGHDIVCAAVSALTQGTAHGLQAMADSGAEVEQSDGHLVCRIRSPGIVSQTILACLKLSLEDLKNQYGDYINVCHG